MDVWMWMDVRVLGGQRRFELRGLTRAPLTFLYICHV